ncbi:MAG: alkaline phosphatase family protein, partial [Flavobacteriaceae bacterium]|nr:alkaline phosphatase family protein [Flavobacteriaceae bacterium]
YIPTKTAPGHASIYTGTTATNHGVIANDWYQKSLNGQVYCVSDNTVKSVGSNNSAGQMSPHRMLVTTFPDENRLFTQMKGKTIAISIKDRGSILPGGHTANGAYWFDMTGTGNWISSSFYMNELPKWVEDFNESNITEGYFRNWNTLYDIETYTESGPDLTTFEGGYSAKNGVGFPYDLKALAPANGNYNIIAESPFGNSLTTDFVLAAIQAEQLGLDKFTDVLAVSYSSTDKVGHNFGPNSKEVEDTFIRLDKEIERLLNHLDKVIGKGEYTVFLTSDHGTMDVPNYLKENRIPAGLFDLNKMRADLNQELQEKYNIPGLILSTINNQIYLDDKKMLEKGIDKSIVAKELVTRLLQYEEIDKAFIGEELLYLSNGDNLASDFANGYYPKRSGDILFEMNPSYFKDVEWNRTGTDHGSGFNYDTHIPLIFYGKGIKRGSTFRKTSVIDIAPTMSALLGIGLPNASTGEILEFVIQNN